MTVLKYFEMQLKKVKADAGAKKSTAELMRELNLLRGLNVEERAAYACFAYKRRISSSSCGNLRSFTSK